MSLVLISEIARLLASVATLSSSMDFARVIMRFQVNESTNVRVLKKKEKEAMLGPKCPKY